MPKLTLKDGKIALFSRYEDRETAKSITGREWSPLYKCWLYPLRAETLNELTIAFPGIEVDPKVSEAVLGVAMREQMVHNIKLHGWEDARPVEPMPLKTQPFKHQVLGYNIACELLGITRIDKRQVM
ncbi:MAG: hypothetical protein A4E55_00354 [Pelotomaculum sp. PtaU1.Bin035]|nr:MAG: hypothetical protein A4E55_00354 [Pelotomaculum sp. PtaU1.Bin035]